MTEGQFLHKKFSVMWLKAVCFFIWEICNVIRRIWYERKSSYKGCLLQYSCFEYVFGLMIGSDLIQVYVMSDIIEIFLIHICVCLICLAFSLHSFGEIIDYVCCYLSFCLEWIIHPAFTADDGYLISVCTESCPLVS